uniref:Uncharacterized protein n=1 Tax=Anguilla anguilla TaxID=7936 RepID=A0A0E9R1G5_ANGAN
MYQYHSSDDNAALNSTHI